jgi:methionyl-tRNA synthetase
MAGKPSFYVTTPIYYVNDSPHIGHAYTSLACDVMARFKRLDGYDVFFLTGTDEHGQKVQKSAQAAGIDPQSFTDRVSQSFRDLAKAMNYSNDDFIRTTEPRHKDACQALWKAIAARQTPKGNDNIYLASYGGWYSVRDEAFWGEDELVTDAEGKKTAPTGAPVEWVEEPSYFFRLSEWGDWLLEFYDKNPDFIGPASRRNEVISFVKGGLQDLSISRTTFDWGVPVPGDPAHIMYVWLDALTNYITAAGYPDAKAPRWHYWPADLHMVGKDILRFHAVYWPAFLAAGGVAVQKRVFAHGWWTNEGQKISKSLGNVIEPLALVAKYGLDPVRYFLLREVPFGSDGDFSHKAVVGRINSELANGIGNLAQRTLAQVNKNCGAKVPAPGAFSDEDKALLDAAGALLGQVRAAIDKQLFHEALEATSSLVRAADGYIDKQAPWALRKTDLARMNTVLYVLAETVRRIALMLLPFMPESIAKLLDQLAVPESARNFASFDVPLAPGTDLSAPQGVFPRFVEEKEGAA